MASNGKSKKIRRRWTRLRVDDVEPLRRGTLELRTLNARDATGPRLSVVHTRLPPGGLHPAVRHRRTQECVLFLKGSAMAELDGEMLRVGPGTFLHLPPGVWHAFRAGPRGVEAVSIFLPALDWNDPDGEVRTS